MRVLLVDHDSEALETVTRAIRGVLELDCVTSKGDALLLLRQNTYDVLIACERCIDGSGLDLLGRTTRTAVPLKRIFAAAPERLQLLGPRLAPFKVQRTINYPIDLEELWLAIAQVTSGPEDETDGTIERVVLDERGIPAEGSVPRSPIPPRPPAPLSAVPAASIGASAGRTATARLPQPTPEPALRPPPPPRAPPPPAARAPAPPRTTSDTGRMRSLVPPAAAPAPPPPQPAPPMAAPAIEPFPAWTPEPQLVEDFAEVSAQARFGVQLKVADEASRRKRQRIIAACGVAVVVAGTLALLIENFYDPQARAREAAIAAQIARHERATEGFGQPGAHRDRDRNRDHEQRPRHCATRVRGADGKGSGPSAARIPEEVDRPHCRTRPALAARRRSGRGSASHKGRDASCDGNTRSGQATR